MWPAYLDVLLTGRERAAGSLTRLCVSSAQHSKWISHGTELVRCGIISTPARFPQTNTEGLLGGEF